MNRIMRCLALILAVSLIVGCEWEGVHDRDDVTASGEETELGEGIFAVSGEIIAAGDGTSTIFSGDLEKSPVIPGSLAISAAGFGFSDNGDGTLTGTAATDGTIAYGSGGWFIDFKDSAIDDAEPIYASYVYGVTNVSTNSI